MKTVSIIAGVAIGCLSLCASARAEVEATARVLFEHCRNADAWIEGFAQGRSNKEIAHFSHRLPAARSHHIEATDGMRQVNWTTAPVPHAWRSDHATFLWVGGIGVRFGEHPFTLLIDEKRKITFTTRKDRDWTVEGPDRSKLTFFSLRRDPGGDLFGYMKLTVPAGWVSPGQPVRLRIQGPAAGSLAWTMVFTYTDAVVHLRQEEIKDLYHEVSLRNMGDAIVALAARPEWNGRSVVIRAADAKLAEATLRRKDDVSVGVAAIPFHLQRGLTENPAVIVDGRTVGTIDLAGLAKQRTESLLNEELELERYLFPPGDLPKVAWKRPAMVEREGGPVDLTVTWYDGQMKPVTKAEKPGRYAVVVTGSAADGYPMQRFVTCYCTPAEVRWWEGPMNVSAKPFAPFGIDESVWTAERKLVDAKLGAFILREGLKKQEFAALLAGLREPRPRSDLPDSWSDPDYLDRQWWVDFKRRQPGVTDKYPALSPPSAIDGQPAPVLREGDPASVGYNAEDLAAIRKVCEEWAAQGGEPLVTLVARRGVIVFHEAFGNHSDGSPMTRETPTWMASITKFLTGTLMMRFVDQGLVGLDEPVKRYLPELDRPVRTDLTIRHLFTHTNGFRGHDTWGVDWNSSFENAVGQYLPYLDVGTKHEYNGVGYAVAGKLMERISGQAVPLLFQKHLLGPLQAAHTIVAGTAGDARSTCMDMAKVAQMLLCAGRYGSLRFFSPETFATMLPVPLSRLVPGLDLEGGIGCHWCKGNGLSDKTFGHGAASGAILRIDPEHELVIVSCRDRLGKDYGAFADRLIAACAAPATRPAK